MTYAAFKSPEGHDARKILSTVVMVAACALAVVAGWLWQGLVDARSQAATMEGLMVRAVEQNHTAILAVDREGLITYASPSFLALTGYAREDVHHQSLTILVPPGMLGYHTPAYQKKVRETVAGEETGSTFVRCDLLKADGTTVDVLMQVSILKDGFGVAAITPAANVKVVDPTDPPSPLSLLDAGREQKR